MAISLDIATVLSTERDVRDVIVKEFRKCPLTGLSGMEDMVDLSLIHI